MRETWGLTMSIVTHAGADLQGIGLEGTVCRRQNLARPSPLTDGQRQTVATYLAELEATLAPDRLASYRPPGADDLTTIATYFWNVALSRDLHFCLGAAEVSMRNGIHHALSAHAGQANWYDVIPLLPKETEAIQKAKQNIRNSRKTLVPGRVVAELSFGFWTSLLSAGFGPHGYGGALWSPNYAALIILAFPFLKPPNQNRSYVHRRFNTLRLLRNRTMHHEPIWNGMTLRQQQRTVTISLSDLYDDILDAIGWSSPRLCDSVMAFDRFPETLATGLPGQAKAIETFLGF
jgi:hypothetical protein